MGKINDAIDIVKTGLDVQVSLATADQKMQLADARIALADLKETIAEQKEQILSLKDQQKVRNAYKLEKGVYWLLEDSSQNQPYCPVCYAKGTIIPMKHSWPGVLIKEQTPWTCADNTCNASADIWGANARS